MSPAGTSLRKGEVWFGIWLRAENQTEQPELSAVNFDIRDTLGNTFDPIAFPPGVNSLIYKPTLSGPAGCCRTPRRSRARAARAVRSSSSSSRRAPTRTVR